VLYIHVNYS